MLFFFFFFFFFLFEDLILTVAILSIVLICVPVKALFTTMHKLKNEEFHKLSSKFKESSPHPKLVSTFDKYAPPTNTFQSH